MRHVWEISRSIRHWGSREFVEIRRQDVHVNDPALALGIPQGWPIFDGIIPDRDHEIGGIEKPV